MGLAAGMRRPGASDEQQRQPLARPHASRGSFWWTVMQVMLGWSVVAHDVHDDATSELP
jgi:hypothetical protein